MQLPVVEWMATSKVVKDDEGKVSWLSAVAYKSTQFQKKVPCHYNKEVVCPSAVLQYHMMAGKL